MAASTPGYVDSHTHLFPEGLARAIRNFFVEHIGDGLIHPIDPVAVLDALAADGVREVWNLPYVRMAGRARALNEGMLAVAADLAEHQVTVVTGCTAHPGDDDPGGEIARAADAGAAVVKLHCSVGDFDADDRRLDPIYEMAGTRGLPVVVHAGHGVSGHTEPDELAPIVAAARRDPETVIILAHLGHRAAVRAAGLVAETPNLWADLTPVLDELPDLRLDVIRPITDRLLLGSDAPNTGRMPGEIVTALVELGLDDGEIEAITSGNAKRLVPA